MGHDGDPLGRLILGLLVPLSSTSRVTGGVVVQMVVVATVVVGTSGTSISSLSLTSIDINWFPVGVLTFLLSTAARNCQVDANASALLASFVPCRDLGTPEVGLLCIVFAWMLGISI